MQPLGGKAARIEMSAAALARFAAEAARMEALVVFEASGGYDRPLASALEAAGVAHARVDPGKARRFARATGRRAKTDRLAAALLAEMGARLDLAPSVPLPPARRALKALAARRRQLVAMRQAERTRLPQAPDALCRGSIDRLLALLDAEIDTDRGRDRGPDRSGAGARRAGPPAPDGPGGWGRWWRRRFWRTCPSSVSATGVGSRRSPAWRRWRARAAGAPGLGRSAGAARWSGACSISRRRGPRAAIRA